MNERERIELDRYFKPCGPCLFCGHPDKRHRLWDSIIGLDESDELTSRLYDYPVEAIKLVRKIKPYQ